MIGGEKGLTENKMTGIITKSTGSWYEILGEDNNKYRGRLRGKFKIKDLKVTNPIAVGDKVVYEVEVNGDNAVSITDILPRENYIIRKSVHKASHGHMIAANMDQTLLIVTLAQPRTSLGFIDRFLVSAEAFRIPAILVFNKWDLYSEGLKKIYNELKEIYDNLGYKCIVTSTKENIGIEDFKETLEGRTTLVSGHSGVGKSSLLNSIAPNLNLKTGEISDFAHKGTHTTTFAEMFELAPATFVIDTPGIKELGVFEIDEDELSHYFPEMRDRLGECKFHNCRHINEPKCAIIDKVKSGEIALSRYESYLSIVSGGDNRK